MRRESKTGTQSSYGLGAMTKMRIAQIEIFGPVLCMLPYEDEEDAIRTANDSFYGLGGPSAITKSRACARGCSSYEDGHGLYQQSRVDPYCPFRWLQEIG
jgi:aldehyde dehydrogenase (NAD+)